MTAINDEMAALLCDLAAAHLRRDWVASKKVYIRLQARGWDAPTEAATRIGLAAIVEEQKARPKP